MWSIFELCGRFLSYVVGFIHSYVVDSVSYLSYVVDFTPQRHIGQDGIVISYIMDTFSPHKTLYRSIKKAMRFLCPDYAIYFSSYFIRFNS